MQDILEEKYLRESSSLPVSPAQFRLLKLLALEGEHPVGEVAELLGVSSPAACKNVDKLEGLGLVSRVASSGDRRVTLLAATKNGRSLVRRYESTKARRLGRVLEGVGARDVEQLTRLLERFSTVLFRTEAEPPGYCLRCAAYGDASCPLITESCPCARVQPAAGRAGRRPSGTGGGKENGSGAASAAEPPASEHPIRLEATPLPTEPER